MKPEAGVHNNTASKTGADYGNHSTAPDLWDRVHKRCRQQPLRCRRCKRDVVPALSETKTRRMVRGSCPDCGRYLKFLPLAREPKQHWPKKRKAHVALPLPVETAESLALWEVVNVSRGPMLCYCGQAMIPVLSQSENGILAVCAACGHGIRHLRRQRAGDTEEQRRERFGMWRRIGFERGWKAGAAAHRYRRDYGEFPPWDWTQQAEGA